MYVMAQGNQTFFVQLSFDEMQYLTEFAEQQEKPPVTIIRELMLGNITRIADQVLEHLGAPTYDNR